MSIYESLNPVQQEAVYHTKDRFLFWQGPGQARPEC